MTGESDILVPLASHTGRVYSKSRFSFIKHEVKRSVVNENMNTLGRVSSSGIALMTKYPLSYQASLLIIMSDSSIKRLWKNAQKLFVLFSFYLLPHLSTF